MANKTVDRAEMAKAAQQIETKHQEIHRLQMRLQSEMSTLGASWTGQASAAFQRGYAAFDGEFEKVKQSLDTIHSRLVETQRAYVQREDENQATANSIANLIG